MDCKILYGVCVFCSQRESFNHKKETSPFLNSKWGINLTDNREESFYFACVTCLRDVYKRLLEGWSLERLLRAYSIFISQDTCLTCRKKKKVNQLSVCGLDRKLFFKHGMGRFCI